jgi:hypothetical protein
MFAKSRSCFSIYHFRQGHTVVRLSDIKKGAQVSFDPTAFADGLGVMEVTQCVLPGCCRSGEPARCSRSVSLDVARVRGAFFKASEQPPEQ